MKKKLLIIIMAVVALTITACGTEKDQETVASEGSAENQDREEKIATFKVVGPDGVVNMYEIVSIEDMLGTVLLDIGLIKGEESDNGLVVTSVIDIQLDKGTEWKFYVDGEYTKDSLDTIEMVAGKLYEYKTE